MRVLVVEDDVTLAAGLVEGLERESFKVDHLGAAEPAENVFGHTDYDLAIVDIGLPGMDGLELIRRVRRRGVLTPILILTARDGLDDRVVGLDVGGDDYLVKPFLLPELLARVRALLRRRSKPEGETAQICFGDVAVDFSRRQVSRSGEPVKLTPIEYRLLGVLITNAGKVMTHRQLLREVWGPAYSDSSHYLRIYVGHLRHKLEDDPAQPRHFLTETGVGYRFQL